MEEKMRSSAPGTGKKSESTAVVHKVVLALAVTSIGWFMNLPAAAQSGKKPATSASPSTIPLADEIRRVKAAYATTSNEIAEPATADEVIPLKGSVAPE